MVRTRAIEERFLHCASRRVHTSEREEKASARFGRNDSWGLWRGDTVGAVLCWVAHTCMSDCSAMRTASEILRFAQDDNAVGGLRTRGAACCAPTLAYRYVWAEGIEGGVNPAPTKAVASRDSFRGVAARATRAIRRGGRRRGRRWQRGAMGRSWLAGRWRLGRRRRRCRLAGPWGLRRRGWRP